MARSQEAAPAPAPTPQRRASDRPGGSADAHAKAVLALRAEFTAKADELKALFDRMHDLVHDVQRK